MSDSVNRDDLVQRVIPQATERRQRALLPLLRTERQAVPTRVSVEGLSQPDHAQAGVRFDYTYDQLVAICERLTPGTPEDLRRVLRYALIWCGVTVDDDRLHWTALDHGFVPGSRLARATLPVDDKRLSIRLVPDHWAGEYGSAFRLRGGQSGGTVITAVDRHGQETIIARPLTRYIGESVQTLAYHYGLADGRKRFTINPLQRCPQSCEWCCRGYHDMTPARRSELVNLAPDEMARALLVKFPQIEDWREVAGITLVTGDFSGEDAVVDYLTAFVEAMSRETSGRWDPRVTDQDIAVSTHLVRSRPAMERLKALGMKRFIHTVEMVDDDRREVTMHLNRREFISEPGNKGHTGFMEALDVLAMAIEIYGPDAAEPVLVIGLDSLELTRRAMDDLHGIGIRRVSRALVNVYDFNQFALMQGSFEDAVAGMQYARDRFASAHPRRVSEFADARDLRPSDDDSQR
jgi:hypothetical protein